MELTELKRVQNTGELPEYSGGKEWLDKKNSVGGTNLGAISTGAVGVLDMASSIGAASKFNRTADDLLRDAGTSQNNIGGVGYTVQNGLDDKQIESEVNAENTANTVGLVGKGASTGAAIGSLAGPVGGVIGGAVGAIGGFIGGLFGGGAKKREMRRQMRLAEYKRINTNSFNKSGALTTVLQNNLAQTEGNQEDQALYGAANGKESYSAGGPTSGYNARVSNGEIIANKFTGEMFRVPGIPNNKDGKLAFIRPSDTIISNKYGLSDYVANTGDLEGGEAMQGTIMKALGKRGYKNGKLPGYKFGLEEINAIGNLGLGALSMLDSYNKRNESVKSPYTYSGNTWEAPALNIMRNIRTNAYPIMPQIYDNMAKGMYTIDNAGGLGGGQRTLARLAAITDAGNNIARLQTAAQEQNNKYQQDYAQAALNAGNADATRRMQANQWDLDYYSRAHGAREKMADQRRADALTFFQSYLKGVNDIGMFNKQMEAWWADYYAKHPEKDPKNRPQAEVKNKDTFNYSMGIPVEGNYNQVVQDKFKKAFEIPAPRTLEQKQQSVVAPDIPEFNFSEGQYKKGSVSAKAAKAERLDKIESAKAKKAAEKRMADYIKSLGDTSYKNNGISNGSDLDNIIAVDAFLHQFPDDVVDARVKHDRARNQNIQEALQYFPQSLINTNAYGANVGPWGKVGENFAIDENSRTYKNAYNNYLKTYNTKKARELARQKYYNMYNWSKSF